MICKTSKISMIWYVDVSVRCAWLPTYLPSLSMYLVLSKLNYDKERYVIEKKHTRVAFQ